MAVILSIIVPIFNAEKFIARCIESILKQQFKDFELILINDGSSDNSGAICDQFALMDTRISVIRQQNEGVSVARNRGLDKAIGTYIIFIDSDDWIEPEFINAYFKELEFDNFQLIYQGLINDFKDSYTFLRLPKSTYIEAKILDALYEVELRSCLGGACNKIFIREIIDKNKIRFNPSLSYGEDKIFTLQYCKYISKVTLLDTCYYHYNRVVENSLSVSYYTSGKLIELIELEYSLFKQLNEKYLNNRFINAVSGRYISILKLALLSMYRPGMLVEKNKRISLMERIDVFRKTQIIDSMFDRDVPKIASLAIKYKNDSALLFLMWFRRNFSFVYSLLRKTER